MPLARALWEGCNDPCKGSAARSHALSWFRCGRQELTELRRRSQGPVTDGAEQDMLSAYSAIVRKMTVFLTFIITSVEVEVQGNAHDVLDDWHHLGELSVWRMGYVETLDGHNKTRPCSTSSLILHAQAAG